VVQREPDFAPVHLVQRADLAGRLDLGVLVVVERAGDPQAVAVGEVPPQCQVDTVLLEVDEDAAFLVFLLAGAGLFLVLVAAGNAVLGVVTAGSSSCSWAWPPGMPYSVS